MSAAIRVRGLTVVLEGDRILDRIDLDVAAGEWLALLGPNGAGKTTFVRALSGTVKHGGSVDLGHMVDAMGTMVGDRPLRTDAEPSLRDGPAGPRLGRATRLRARRIAVVPQTPIIPAGITAFEYVLLGRTPYQGLRMAASIDDRRRTLAVLQRLDLERFAARDVATLSGGERQRVVLARALVADTPVLVLDEPTAALDLGHQFEILELLAELQRERGLTVITTLHDLGVAGQFGDRLAVLHEGRLVAHGTPSEVLTPDHIGRWWGVEVTTDADTNGRVSVTVRRRLPARSPIGTAVVPPAVPPESEATPRPPRDATPASGR
jgi:iron complex transport system ATP-binding protein